MALTGGNANAAAPRPHWSAFATAAFMLALLAGACALWVADVESASVNWIPSWDADLRFRFDGLGFMYALIAAGIGLVVVVFSALYLPRHLEETDAPQERQPRFYLLLALFAFSMVGLAYAGDLLLVFVFWDLTAVASYFLIAFDREKQDARRGALTAMLVTGITGVLLLIGAVILWAHYGTFELDRLFAAAEDDVLTTTAAGLIAAAALAKSAQAPFHLWLPRAMVAPTPVSAYLHSAAMVAAGVLLIGRMYPLIEQSQLLRDLLLGFGLASIAVGAVLALAADELKRILAYSTISQYGYVVAMYGLGGGVAAGAAAFYVIGHAVEKSALFLTAGAVGQATHTERLSELGGLLRSMPVLAVGSGLAAAGLAALPLTLGFFQDELFFKAAVEHGWAAAGAAAAAATLTLAYIGRFWAGLFLGRRTTDADPIPRSLTWPVLALGGLLAVGGIWAMPVEQLAEEAAGASGAGGVHLDAAYKLELSAENVLALCAYGGGAALLVTLHLWRPAVESLARAGGAVGPTRLYERTLTALNATSDRIHRFEVRDLRTRIAAVLLPGGVLVGAALITTPPDYEVGGLPERDVPLAAAVTATAVGAFALVTVRRHLALAMLVGGVGYALAAVYAFFGAPDVALAAALVETVLALLFFGVLAIMPRGLLRQEERAAAARERKREPLIALVAGVSAFLVAWGALSGASSPDPVGPRYPDLASEAHAKDAVTAVLADFRGLDTMAEVSVVLVAIVGLIGLVRRGPLW